MDKKFDVRGERIKELREKYIISMEALAQLSGFSGKSHIQQLESGKLYSIKHLNLMLMAKALNCTPDYLTGASDSPDESCTAVEDLNFTEYDVEHLEKVQKQIAIHMENLNSLNAYIEKLVTTRKRNQNLQSPNEKTKDSNADVTTATIENSSSQAINESVNSTADEIKVPSEIDNAVCTSSDPKATKVLSKLPFIHGKRDETKITLGKGVEYGTPADDLACRIKLLKPNAFGLLYYYLPYLQSATDDNINALRSFLEFQLNKPNPRRATFDEKLTPRDYILNRLYNDILPRIYKCVFDCLNDSKIAAQIPQVYSEQVQKEFKESLDAFLRDTNHRLRLSLDKTILTLHLADKASEKSHDSNTFPMETIELFLGEVVAKTLASLYIKDDAIANISENILDTFKTALKEDLKKNNLLITLKEKPSYSVMTASKKQVFNKKFLDTFCTKDNVDTCVTLIKPMVENAIKESQKSIGFQ